MPSDLVTALGTPASATTGESAHDLPTRSVLAAGPARVLTRTDTLLTDHTDAEVAALLNTKASPPPPKPIDASSAGLTGQGRLRLRCSKPRGAFAAGAI